MTVQTIPTETTNADTIHVSSRGAERFEVPPEDLDPISARQALLASLGQKSVRATDITGFALDAAKSIAESLEMDGYSLTQKIVGNKGLRFHFGSIDSTAKQTVRQFDLPAGAQDSMSGYAMAAQRPVVAFDVNANTLFTDPLLHRLEVKSSLVCPLMQANGPIGAMGVYRKQRFKFRAADVYFFQSVANLVAVSYARNQAEEMVTTQSRRLEALVAASTTPTLELTPEGRILDGNRALEQLTGFSLSEIEERSIYSAFVVPGELNDVKSALAKAHTEKACTRQECFLLTKTGERRRVIWSFNGVVDSAGNTRSLICTGIDITEQHELNDRARRAEAIADNAMQSLRVVRAKAAEDRMSNRSGSSAHERRKIERRPFPYKQILAPITKGRLPSPDQFREVRCHDLSSCGFSFHAEEIPDYQELLIAFGKQGDLIYLTAQIAHVSPITVQGKDMYLVGCRYTGRADYS